MKRIYIPFLACTFLSVAQAQLTVYDGFNYSAGALAGNTGGSGLSGAWSTESGTGLYQVANDGLTFSDLLVSGGRIQVTTLGGAWTPSSRIARPLVTPITAGQTFGSFLYRRQTDVDLTTVGGVQFGAANASDNSHPAQFYTTEWQQAVGARTDGGSTSVSGSSIPINQTFLVLFSANLSPGAQTLDLWVMNSAQYDNLKTGGITVSELDSATIGTGSGQLWAKSRDVATEATLRTMDHVKFMTFGGGSGVASMSYDELRIGTTLDSVIPLDVEPPTVVSVTPPDGSTTAVEPDLVVTFNEPIAIGSGNITIKNLTDATQTVIDVTDLTQITVTGAVLTINPTSDLLLGKNYAVQIDATAIDDTKSNSFAGILDDTTWNFASDAPAPTTTTVVSSGSPTIYGDSVTFTATVTSSSGTPAGSVQFFSDVIGPIGNPVTVNSSTGQASVTTTMLGAGTNSIDVTYSGNFQFAGSSSVPISQVVNKATLTVTAEDKVRVEGIANPTLTAQITGFRNGQNLASSGVFGTPALSTTAVPASPVGTYPITCDVTGMFADNYDFTTAPGTLTVVAPVAELAYDGFNYAAGALAGNSGGFGFSGAWGNLESSNGGFTAQADGLTFSTLVVTGGRTEGNATPGGGKSLVQRNLSTSLTGQIFGSYLYRQDTVPVATTVNGFMMGAPSEPDNDSTVSIYPDEWERATVGARSESSGGSAGASATIGVGTTYLVLFSANLIDSTPTITMWVLNSAQFDTFKPGGLTEAELNGAAIGTGSSNVWGRSTVTGTDATLDLTNNVKFMAYGGFESGTAPTTRVSFDEFRLSQTSLNDVAPVQPGFFFTNWSAANAPGQPPGQDHDNDGVQNGVEYFMGESGSSFTAMPSLNASNTISWTADAAYQGTYEVQTSPDLVTWTNVDPRPVPVAGILSYTLPPGAPDGKSFVRLLVTPTP